MDLFNFLKILLILKVLHATTGKNYEADILEINFDLPDERDFDLDINVKRVSREVTALSGFLEFRKDVTDEQYVEMDIFRSVSGNAATYTRTPFRVGRIKLSDGANMYYKPYIEKGAKTCATNLPEFAIFNPPITARRIEFVNCTINTEEFPSEIKPAFYRVVIKFSGQNEGTVTMLVKVEEQEN